MSKEFVFPAVEEKGFAFVCDFRYSESENVKRIYIPIETRSGAKEEALFHVPSIIRTILAFMDSDMLDFSEMIPVLEEDFLEWAELRRCVQVEVKSDSKEYS